MALGNIGSGGLGGTGNDSGGRLAAILVALSIALFTLSSREGGTGPLSSVRNAFTVVTTPFDYLGLVVTRPVSGLANVFENLTADRATLSELEEENEELRRLAKRAEVVSALADDDLRKFRERTELQRVMLSLRMEELQAERKERGARRKAALDAALEERLRRRSEARLSSLDSVREALEKGIAQAGLSPMVGGVPAEDLKRELREAIKKLERARKTVQSRESRRYRQAARILRGNPSARAPRHGEALRSLRDVAGLRGKEKDD